MCYRFRPAEDAIREIPVDYGDGQNLDYAVMLMSTTRMANQPWFVLGGQALG